MKKVTEEPCHEGFPCEEEEFEMNAEFEVNTISDW